MRALAYGALAAIGFGTVWGTFGIVAGIIQHRQERRFHGFVESEIANMEKLLGNRRLAINLPEFFVDPEESKEENLQRLYEHLIEHAPEMPEDQRADFLAQFEREAVFEKAVEEDAVDEFQGQLDDLEPGSAAWRALMTLKDEDKER